MTTVLLDRLTHHCHFLASSNDCFRFRASSTTTKQRAGTTHALTKSWSPETIQPGTSQ